MKEQAYIDAVERLARHHPNEPLLPTLQQGFSALNVVYLRHVLANLPDPTPPAPAEPLPEKPAADLVDDEKTDIEPTDETLRGLWAERRRLWGEWAKTSNRFHDCSTDAERALISDQVAQVWAWIQAIKARIEHYEQHGCLPPAAEDERFPLPDDPVALVKKLNSIRAMISQAEARLRALAELPDGDPDRSQIPDVERRRAELILYRGHAETKIGTLQQGGLGES